MIHREQTSLLKTDPAAGCLDLSQIILFLCSVTGVSCEALVQASGTDVTIVRELCIQGEGNGTACVVVNQLWTWLFFN